MFNIETKTKLILGFVFLLFDYSLDMGPMVFIALPTFIGFALLAWGLADISSESTYFVSLKKMSIIMTPIFFIIYLNNMNDWLSKLLDTLLKSHPNNGAFIKNTTGLFFFIQFTLNVLLILAVVYATYLFVSGLRELAVKKGGAYPSYGKQLFNSFQIYSALKALQLIIYAMASFGTSTVAFASDIFSLCAIVPSVMILFQANRLYNMLYPR